MHVMDVEVVMPIFINNLNYLLFFFIVTKRYLIIFYSIDGLINTKFSILVYTNVPI